MELSGFYFITDSSLSKKDAVSDVESAVAGGAGIVQYRDKGKSLIAFLDEACRIRELCHNNGVLFIINDEVGAAMLSGADGVHLGQDDMPAETARRILGKGKVIGVTGHSVEEAAKAVKDGANYLGVSPIFSTMTKKDAGPPAGLDLLRKVRKITSIPIVAIGGIKEENASAVIDAGADAISAISATVAQDDVKSKVAIFAKKFKR